MKFSIQKGQGHIFRFAYPLAAMTLLSLGLSGCAEVPPSKPVPHSVVLQADQIIISRAAYQQLQQRADLAQSSVTETASCISAQGRVASLQKELTALRAGDPSYQNLQNKLTDLQNRLTQSQQRESELRKKLNELIQIEKNSRTVGGR